MGGRKDGTEVLLEGIEEDVLDGESELFIDVELSATLGLADMDPVGSPVAGALEAVALDEGFDEDGSEGEALSPVVLDAAGGQGEELGGEAFGFDPGEDEEAGVVDNEGEARLPLIVRPADEGVPGGDLPGGGAEAQTGQRGLSREGEVADLGSGKGLVAEVVIALYEVVPEMLLGPRGGGAQMKIRTGRKGPVIGRLGSGQFGVADPPGPGAIGVGALGGGQDEKAVPLHPEEGHAAGERREGPVGLDPAEALADLAGEGRPLEGGILSDPLPDPVDLGIGEEAARIDLHAGSLIAGRDRRARLSEDIAQGSQGDRSEGADAARAQASR